MKADKVFKVVNLIYVVKTNIATNILYNKYNIKVTYLKKKINDITIVKNINYFNISVNIILLCL